MRLAMGLMTSVMACTAFSDLPRLDDDDGANGDARDGAIDSAGDIDAAIDANVGPDEDGDGISDIDEGIQLQPPLDTDDDGVPDYLDLDSDDDTIADAHEGLSDPDEDGVPNFRDRNSDADCRLDAVEAGDADLATPPRDSDGDQSGDWLERDADGDWIDDALEDRNCNGVLDAGETDPTRADSDGDGFDDLIESAVGAPRDENVAPHPRYALRVVTPVGAAAHPTTLKLAVPVPVPAFDLFFLLSEEMATIVDRSYLGDNLVSIVDDITNCTDYPAECLLDVQTGGGVINGRSAPQPFATVAPISANAGAAAAAIAAMDGTGTDEAIGFSTWTAITGQGTATAAASYGCSFAGALGVANCPAGRHGHACFREVAIPVVLWYTNESLGDQDVYDCPSMMSQVAAVAQTRGARLVGVSPSTHSSTSITIERAALALATRASYAFSPGTTGSGTPLILRQPDPSPFDQYLDYRTGLRKLSQIPLRLTAEIVDLPEDGINGVNAFVDHIESTVGTGCAGVVPPDADTDGDSHPDAIQDVTARQTACWTVVPRGDHSAPADPQYPQVYGVQLLAEIDRRVPFAGPEIYFVVPPQTPAPAETPPPPPP